MIAKQEPLFLKLKELDSVLLDKDEEITTLEMKEAILKEELNKLK